MDKIAKEAEGLFGSRLLALAAGSNRVAGVGLGGLAKSGGENLMKLLRQVYDRVNTKKLKQMTETAPDWSKTQTPGAGGQEMLKSFMRGLSNSAKPFAAALARKKDLDQYILNADMMVDKMEEVMRARGLAHGTIRMRFDQYTKELKFRMGEILNKPQPALAQFYEYELPPGVMASYPDPKHQKAIMAKLADPATIKALETSLASNSISQMVNGTMKFAPSITVKMGNRLTHVPITVKLKPGAEAGIQKLIDKEFEPVYKTINKFESENLWMKQLPKAGLHIGTATMAVKGYEALKNKFSPQEGSQAEGAANATIKDPYADSPTNTAIGDQLGVGAGDMAGEAAEDQLFPGTAIKPGQGDFENLKRWNRNPDLDPRHLVPIPENAEFDMYGFRRSVTTPEGAERLAQAPPTPGVGDVASVGRMLGGDGAKMSAVVQRIVSTSPNSGNADRDLEALRQELETYAGLNAAALERVGDALGQPILQAVEQVVGNFQQPGAGR